MITLTIDGKQIQVPPGTRVLQAARKAGIIIPNLCAHPSLHPFGGCRLCIVEIEGMRGYPTSCTTPAEEGMVVKTDTPETQKLRLEVLELILTEHPYFCLTCSDKEKCQDYQSCIRKVGVTTGCRFCPSDKRCELQQAVETIGLKEVTQPVLYRAMEVERTDPFFERDYNLCILCGRCVRVCQDIRGAGTLAFQNRGAKTVVGTAYRKSHLECNCHFCGACISVCPTGALSEKVTKWSGIPDKDVISTCAYCAVGCQLHLEVKDGELIGTKMHDDPMINGNQGCVKGRFSVVEVVNHEDRLTRPLLRRDGKLVPVDWEEAINAVSEKLESFQGDAFAMLASPYCTNEDLYVARKFTREAMQSENIGTSTSLLHSPSLNGLVDLYTEQASLGDVENAQAILVIDASLKFTHSIPGLRAKQAVEDGALLLNVNGQDNFLTSFASENFAVPPGGEIDLIMGLMKVIIEEGIGADALSPGYKEIEELVADVNVARKAKGLGLQEEQIKQAARAFVFRKPSVILLGQTVGLSSYAEQFMEIVGFFALLVGAKVMPLLVPGNARGAWEMGADGKSAIDLIKGKGIKALYLLGESLSERPKGVKFLITQDIFAPPESLQADAVLPAASFVEIEGTITNLEGRIQKVQKAVEPPGLARPDWWILGQIAGKMKLAGFDYSESGTITEEIGGLIPAYAEDEKSKRKHRSVKVEKRKPSQNIAKPKMSKKSKDYPFYVLQHFSLHSYRGILLNTKVGGMCPISTDGLFQLNRKDASGLGIKDGDSIEVISKNGGINGKAKLSSEIPEGVIFHTVEAGSISQTNPFKANPCPVKIRRNDV